MTTQCLSVCSRATQPVSRARGIGQRFLGAKRLGANHKKRPGGVQRSELAIQIIRVNIRDKMGPQRCVGSTQGVADQPWAQVGATDTNVDDIRKRVVAETTHLPRVYCLHQSAHSRQSCVHDLSECRLRRAGGASQQCVQCRPSFRWVNFLALRQ